MDNLSTNHSGIFECLVVTREVAHYQHPGFSGISWDHYETRGDSDEGWLVDDHYHFMGIYDDGDDDDDDDDIQYIYINYIYRKHTSYYTATNIILYFGDKL